MSVTLVQHRGLTSQRIRAAYRNSPPEAKAMIAEHVLPLTVKQHLAALRRAEAWAVRLGYELAEAVGAPLQIQALILQALGLPLDQAKGRLAAYGEYEAADDAAVMAECERVVLERCRKEPEYAAVLLAKVNGRNGVSHATEVVT